LIVLPASIIFVYAGLAASQWGYATRVLSGRAGELWCGNILSDPLLFLLNGAGPVAAACGIALAFRSIRSRRWQVLPVSALLLFFVTSAGLISGALWLEWVCGMEILSGIWWLPGL
jgi:hypothetical protein